MEEKFNEKRVAAVYFAIIFFTGVLFFKLFVIAQSDSTAIMPSLANQYSRKVRLAERRGFVYDRGGQIICGELAGYNTLVDPAKLDRPLESAVERLRTVCSVDANDLYLKFMSGKPFIIRTSENMTNMYINSVPFYTHDGENADALRHIVGYLDKGGGGVTGLESAYNDFLISTGSYIDAVYEVDATNKSFYGTPTTLINYGYNERSGIELTIDIALQKKAAEIAAKYIKKGAVVITGAQTGEILASVSLPTYDAGNISAYLTSTNGELINRAFSSFTPGSVFKIVVAAAALELDPENYSFEYDCKGGIDVYGQYFNCNNKAGHGNMAMLDAAAHSCNSYFIALGEKIGYDAIYRMAKAFGIGSSTTLDKLKTAAGSITENLSPPPAYTANASIGQGDLLVTPLEEARIFACIANGGILNNLTLVKSFLFADRESVPGKIAGERVISEKTAASLREFCAACVEYGTGRDAKPSVFFAGGKTSSAQSGQYIESISPDMVDENGGPLTVKTQVVHSWFSGFFPAAQYSFSQNGAAAPYPKPLYAISIIAEGGVTDNTKAAYVFRELCDYLASIW